MIKTQQIFLRVFFPLLEMIKNEFMYKFKILFFIKIIFQIIF